MTRETKIGLLVGVAFIIVVGILLTDRAGREEGPAAPAAGRMPTGGRRPAAPAVGDRSVRVLAVDPGTGRAIDGSGFFVSPDGLLVTCRHVVAGNGVVGVVLADGRRLVGSPAVAEDAATGPALALALVRVDGGGRYFPPLPLAAADEGPAPREPVWVASRGAVHAGSGAGWGADADAGPVLLADVPGLGPGDSGGALVDARGWAVGVIDTAGDAAPGTFRAVPAERVRALLERAWAATRPAGPSTTGPAIRGDGP